MFSGTEGECHLFLILNIFSTDILFIYETQKQPQTLKVPAHTQHLQHILPSLAKSHAISLTCNFIKYNKTSASQRQEIEIDCRGKPSVGEIGG